MPTFYKKREVLSLRFLCFFTEKYKISPKEEKIIKRGKEMFLWDLTFIVKEKSTFYLYC